MEPSIYTKPYEFRGMIIPGHMVESLERYIQRRIQPGHFLSAVISNDLQESCARADSDNQKILPAYVAYLYNEAPGACWGSPEKMQNWLNSGEEDSQ